MLQKHKKNLALNRLSIDCSASLAVSHVKTIKKKNKRNVYVRLPDDVKTARSHCKMAFESWKENDYPDGNEICAKITVQNIESIVSNYVIFLINLKPNFATQHIPIFEALERTANNLTDDRLSH